MEKGPYYALKGLRAFFLTLGGVQVNRKMEALDGSGNRIPGLYVAGQDMRPVRQHVRPSGRRIGKQLRPQFGPHCREEHN